MRNSSPRRAGWFVVLTLTGAAALLSACGGDTPPDQALRTRFPAQAAQILEGAASPAPDDGGYRLKPTQATPITQAAHEGRMAPGITARFPQNGAQPVRFDLPSGAVFQVRERGVHGPAEVAGAAIAYARDGGTAFWTKTARGYEEWLLLEAGIACPGAAITAWEVEGGALRQRGDAIDVLDAEGQAQIRVTAPKAFAADGREVPARISVVDGRISIEVDAGCEAALVDPAWELVAPMLSARNLHTETLLPDGRVLVTGGVGSNSFAKATAEIYTVAGDLWSAAAPMAEARSGHRATLLRSGEVLVTGGWSNGSSLATAEIYDPPTNTWMPVAPMQNARFHHTATLLASGKVLVAGGFGSLGSTPSSAELFDPATGSWKALPKMVVPRTWHTATLLPDGRVLVWGGPGLDMFPTQSTPYELFDPATETWSATKQLDLTRQRHTATLLPDGNVVIAGGEVDGVPVSTVQLFEPMTETRDYTTPMLEARAGHTATLLDNGNVLVAGGFTVDGTTFSSTEIYFPQNDRWSFSAPLNVSRHSHTATRLQDSRVLVAGGKNPATLTSAEIFGSAIGEACADVKDCPSGFCVDGVCCDAACDLGQCEACSIANGASQDGHCEIITGASCDDGQACTAGDTCDASGVCLGGAVIECTPSGECVDATCDFEVGACVETPKDEGAYCSIGACVDGVCVEPPDAGTGGAGGAGGTGGAAGAGGEPAQVEAIYVQGGCICGVTGRSGPSSRASWALGVVAAALGMFAVRRASGRRA